MMYNYPFFSFPHFRRHNSYTPAQYHYIVNTQNLSNLKQFGYNNKWNTTNINNICEQKNKINDNDRFKQTNENYSTKAHNNDGLKNFAKCNNLSKDSTSKKRAPLKRAPSGFSFLNNILNQEDRDDDEEYFDLFGIKLYNDDLLLIGLIFFLYKEDVKDQYLFFALILLLLS